MRIKRVWAKKLYGGLAFDFRLREGINLLVGINGSGKTTALNIVNWLLSLNIPALAMTSFSEVGIEYFDNAGKSAKLRCTHIRNSMRLYGEVAGEKMESIHVHLDVRPDALPDDAETRLALRRSYQMLAPEQKEEKLWSYVKSQGNPLTILLDRTVLVQDGDSYTYDDGERTRARSSKIHMDPIGHVESLARDRYAQYQSQLIKLNDVLKAKLIASSFESGAPSKRSTLLTVEQITAIERKLRNRMSAWNPESAELAGVKAYFRRIRHIVAALRESADTRKSVAEINRFFADELKRVTRLSDAFAAFEDASRKLYEPLSKYLDSLNQLFKDTGKELLFSEKNNGLYFRFVNHPQLPNKGLQSVSFLSSGERQLLILLTFIAFPPVGTNVFVIDEPELSLHPKWQRELLRDIEKLMGTNAQMIIATHSPEIVGRYKDRCVQL